MVNKVLFTFLIADLLFAGTGGLILGFTLFERAHMTAAPTVSNVAVNLILAHTPLTGILTEPMERINTNLLQGGLVNASFILAAFLLSLPALLLNTNKIWLKLHSWLVVACGIVTLVIGLDIWFSTLKTRNNLQSQWVQESKETQSLLQQKVGFMVQEWSKSMLRVGSSIAVVTSRTTLLSTQHVRTPSLQPRRKGASALSAILPIVSSI